MSRQLLRVTHRKFYTYRREFHHQVNANDLFVEITETTTTASGDDYYDFVGDSTRVPRTVTMRALFDFNILGMSREKYGISEDVTNVIYIAPDDLLSHLGYKKFPNKYQITVRFYDENFIVDGVRYLEEMYDDCIGIQLLLKTDRKGG